MLQRVVLLPDIDSFRDLFTRLGVGEEGFLNEYIYLSPPRSFGC
jgi:hypothetical protein